MVSAQLYARAEQLWPDTYNSLTRICGKRVQKSTFQMAWSSQTCMHTKGAGHGQAGLLESLRSKQDGPIDRTLC